MNNDDNFLNAVDITSTIRAKGEYKYYYCGENNSETDKSFLAVATMWYNDRITSDMEILASCHNPLNTAQLFFNNETNSYNILIYKNVIDYRNENMILKLIYQINLAVNFQIDTTNNQIQIDKKKVKIFLVGKNYLIINVVDYNILLLDFIKGNYITIFSRTLEEKETLFNIIDTYDEPYLLDGEQKIRSYVFLSRKNQERKTPTYSYKYFIIQKDVFKLKNILLHSIDFDLGNSEPLGLKIGKIFMPGSGGLKFCFVVIFISSATLFQLITDYDNLNLHNMLKKNSRVENNNKDSDDEDKNENITNKEKDNKDLNNTNKINLDNNELVYNKTKYWTNKRKIEAEKKNITQCIKFILNISDKRICSFVLFFESKNIISYNFNYTDSPEEIKNKIFIPFNINLSLEIKNFDKLFKPPAKLFKFAELYLFKNSSFFNYSKNNLIICDKNKMHIYSEENQVPVYTYEFYKEDLSCFIILEGLGSTFLLTGDKLFKIIYNQRFSLFSNEKIFNNWKTNINYYKANKKLSFPVFEFQPEDIWNAYCSLLGLEKIELNEREIINKNNEEIKPAKNNRRITSKNIIDKYCTLCGAKSERSCSDCNIRFYCCEEHFKYDFYSFHFFECQWIQFFSRKDIMNISDHEIRYKVLYNELIKVCGRILTYIFMRIYSKKDYQYFLNMILTMVKILDNFGFKLNLSEFCSCNYTLNERIVNRYQKIIFYQEALFFYVNLNFLKCTFALKSGLYNLTDCYLKIINNDIIPLLTPKMNKRLISLKCDKPNIDILYNNQYFNEFNSELFFNIEKFVKNNSAPNNLIDLVEEYITKHLMSLSLLVKFKKKINSTMEVQNSFVDINLMFDDHFNESEKKITSYCYFFTSFYLVEIGKIPQTVKLLKRLITFFAKLDNDVNILKYLTHYNLGLIQYALGNFDIGIHNMETAYKLIVENNFSDKIKLKVMDSLSLAYLNRRNLYKAFLLIKKSIQERKKLSKKGDEIDCTKLDVYLNYINDLYEYTFISKARLLIKKKYNNSDEMKLMKFVLGEEDKEMVISEQNISQFVKVAKFVWDLPEDVLRQLNIDNPPRALNNNNNKEEQHHDKSVSFNSEISGNMTTTFMFKENPNEKDDMEEDYEDDIEIKTSLYDTLLSRKQQQDFKELKAIYLKRDIILRDSLGDIEKFNINYEPIFAAEFESIIEKLKSSFLLKEIFYSFQNEKWRDELYNYNQNNILFGLSKYLKMEKIKNMLAIEKTKILEAVKQKKLKVKQKQKNEGNININISNDNLLIDNKNKIAINETNIFNEDNGEKEIEISNEISSGSSSSSQLNEKQNKKVDETNINYKQFKSKFIEALTELEKDKGNRDLYEFLDFDEDYLYNLYINVFKNNPDYKFIIQNPLLILNYIFIDINKKPRDKVQNNILEPDISSSKDKEKDNEEKKSEEIKGIEEEKKESEEDEEKNKFNSSSSTSKNQMNNINDNKNDEEKEDSNENSDEKEKQENEENKQNNENDINKNNNNNNNNKEEEEEIKFILNRKNSFMEQFQREENIYNYTRDEINETREISLEYILKKEIIPPPSKEKKETILSHENKVKQERESKSRKSVNNNMLFLPLIQDKKPQNPKTLIEEADKYFLTSKENSKIQDNEKTFDIIQKNNRRRTQIDMQKLNINESTNKKEEEKNESANNLIKKKNINYMPFINKKKKTSRRISRKDSKNNNNVEKEENEPYFNLKKEMEMNENKKRKKRREHNLSVDILVKKDLKLNIKRMKVDVEKNYYEQFNSNSFEKILNNKNTNKNKSMQNIKSKSKSKKKNRGKNTSFRFKSKDEREKEIENGALLYLKNEYKLKKKNIMNVNNSALNAKPNRNKNNIYIKKRIFKSTDEKKVYNINKSDIEQENYKNICAPKIKYKNRNKKRTNQKEIKFNSSTTLNSTSIEYNSINAKKPIKNKNKNDTNKNNIKIEKQKRKIKKDLFSEEYKKIIEYNKRKRNLSQDKNYDNKMLRINLDNNYENELRNLYTNNQNMTSKYPEFNGASPILYKQDIHNIFPKTGDRKLYDINNFYKKNNFIPTTNYTNSESPRYTRLVTFQGKGNNLKPRSKEKYKE